MAVVINGTTGITSVNGSASAPSVTGTDTDTGIVYGTNTLSLATGGTTAVTVDSSQNVGIGTSSPGTKLDVLGGAFRVKATSTNDGIIYVDNSSASNAAIVNFGINGSLGACSIVYGGSSYGVLGGANSLNFYNTTSGPTVFYSSSTERMRIDTAGNVGIGTSSPYYKLSVNSSNGINSYNGVSGLGKFVLGDPIDPTGYVGMYRGSAGDPNTAGNDLSLGSYGIITFRTGATSFGSQTERMRIDSSGNVGIGTITPSSYGGKLAVIGGTTRTSAFAVGGGDYGTGRGYIYLNGGGYDQSVIYDAWAGSATTPEQAAGKHIFSTGGTERARIDSSGNLLVGCVSIPNVGATPAQYGFSVSSSEVVISKAYNTPALYIKNIGGTSTAINFYNGQTQVGSIGTTSSATSYITASDYRLKNSVLPMTGALARVSALKPCTYKWNADGTDGEGFIAHELAEVCPYAVTGEKDAVNEDGSIKPQGIDTSFLVATLTAAIQEQQAIIEQLRADVAQLKGQA